MKTSKEELFNAALDLPIAVKSDFLNLEYFGDSEDELIRTINDTSLRTKLIKAGLAEGIQSPKGPQAKIVPSIIRLYPNGDAPAREKRQRVNPTPPKETPAKPTVEDLKALVTRIEAVEAHVAREMELSAEEDIRKLRERIASGTIEELPAVHAELGKALEIAGNGRHHARLEALRRVSEDHEFPQRVFVSLVAA